MHRALRIVAETTYIVIVVFALPVTFEFERDEVSVMLVVFAPEQRWCRGSIPETCRRVAPRQLLTSYLAPLAVDAVAITRNELG
jgi:hypothetical protein